MDYQQTVQWMYGQLPMFGTSGAGAYKPGLDTAYALSEAFGNPHVGLRTVHVAGTNGKGSTSHSIASVLMEQGLKVGLYTSPHIFDFRERIRVNGKMIAREAVVDFIERYRAMQLGCSPSFFELTTILAFDYFSTMGVDIAVIETGLGGRLDTTNIITPDLSVITNVSLDHVAQLGDTVEAIAGEKAGIIKSGVPVVIGKAEGGVRKVFTEKAAQMNAPITFAQDMSWNAELVDGVWRFPLRPGGSLVVDCELQGDFQRENMATVLAALDILGNVSDDAVIRGLGRVVENTGLRGRWTTFRKADPRIIFDTGHNIGAWQYIAPALARIAGEGTLRVVLGFVSDKDIVPIFDMLPENAVYYFVSPSTKRGRPASDLLALARARGLNGCAYPSAVDGYRKALEDCSAPGDTIFVGGSNYVVAELPLFQDS